MFSSIFSLQLIVYTYTVCLIFVYLAVRFSFLLHAFEYSWSYVGNQPGWLGKHHVLHSRRALVLGLDLLCIFDHRKCNAVYTITGVVQYWWDCLPRAHICWWRGVVASVVRRMNEVTLRRAQLVLGWMTVFGRVSRYITSQLAQLSLAYFRGR